MKRFFANQEAFRENLAEGQEVGFEDQRETMIIMLQEIVEEVVGGGVLVSETVNHVLGA